MNESKLLSPNGIVKASALCLLMSAFSVNAAFAVPVLDRDGYTTRSDFDGYCGR